MSDNSMGPGWWLASDGKWYPPQQAHHIPTLPPPTAYVPSQSSSTPTAHYVHTFQPPKGYKLKRKRRWPWVLVALVGLFIVASVLSVVGAEDNSQTGGAADAVPSNGPLTVGGTDTTSGFEVTLLQYVDNWTSSNQFEVPSEGKRFVAVQLDLVNTRSEIQTFSTLLGLEVIDSLGQRWPAGLYGIELPSVGGDIAPGTNIRGWQVFEVPSDATGLRLVVKGSITASGVEFQL